MEATKLGNLLKRISILSEAQKTFFSHFIEIANNAKSCDLCILRLSGAKVGKGEIEKDFQVSSVTELLPREFPWNQEFPHHALSRAENVQETLGTKRPAALDNLHQEGPRKKEFDAPSTEPQAASFEPQAASKADPNNASELSATNEPVINHDNTHDANHLTKCPVCLGLLQIDFKTLAQLALESFKSKGYIVKDNAFRLSIRLPFQLPIRQQGIIYHLKAELSNLDQDLALFPSNSRDVKGLFKQLMREAFEKESGMTFDNDSNLVLELALEHRETEIDYKFLTTIPEAKFKVKKFTKRGKTQYEGASAEKISRAVSLVTEQDFKNAGFCPPPPISSTPRLYLDDPKSLSSLFSHAPIFIAGRYLKLKRHISNSQWIISGKRMTEDSMEELIAHFLTPAFRCSSYKFSSAGREDSDVLMLGDGRPFYFELVNPQTTVMDQKCVTELEEKINQNVDGKIRVYDLQLCTLQDTKVLKDSAATKSKAYAYICSSKIVY